MNRIHSRYLKLNVMSLFLIAISSISVTLAWFAYSGIARVATDVDIKSWLIEFEKNDSTVSNDIVISLDDIYPGMGTIHESIKIKNKGDSDAKLSYSIQSVRILDDEFDVENMEQSFLMDKLSHDYPFSINMNLSDNFVLSKGNESEFELSISWPLDSDNDNVDSEWGNLAYQFGINEQQKFNEDSTYSIRPSIKVKIVAKAEQLIESDESIDINFPMGELILYDVVNNRVCEGLNGDVNCIRTHVIDIENKIGDETVTLLADVFGNYSVGTYDKYDDLFTLITNGWNVDVRTFQIGDILKIVSKDINNSLIVRDGLSDSIIGYLDSDERINNIIDKTVKYNGYYSFLNTEYEYLISNKCYWLNREYNNNKGFAFTKIGESLSKIYGEDRTNECSVAPVIIVSKDKLLIKNTSN